MNLTYTWAIDRLQRASSGNLEGIVVQTYWTLTGTDEEGTSGVFHGATPFKLEDVDPLNFTPFDQLTEAQVVGWIEGIVVDDYKAHVDAQLIKQITAAKSPPVDVPSDALPWAAPAA